MIPPAPLGGITVPLNWDGVTTGIPTYITSPAFANFFGILDANGSATATLTLPRIAPLARRQLDFAFVQDGKVWDFASNNASVKLTR